MAISSLLFAIILHFYKNTRKDQWVRFHSEHRFVIAGKKNECTDVGSAAAVMQHTNTSESLFLKALSYLCELLDGMYVGLLGHLPLCFLNVVEVKRWSGRGKARGRLVSNGGQRGEGGHGSQGTHVGQGSRHSSRGHACHSCTHGHVGHTGDSWDIGQTHWTHVGHVGHPHSHRQGERQGQGERGGGRGRQRELQDGFRPQALGNGHPGLCAHGGGIGFGDLQ